jgi:hypothetical protein
MQDYAASFANFSGSFPDILAVNASGPSATDGTEFVANMINDSMWGVWQMILNRAGLTPNGVLESDSASQIRDALHKGFGAPPGVVTQWHLDDDPGTSGHRCLLLNGQGILRANYPDLDAACYVGDANNAAVAAAGGGYYRADNSDGSSPNIAGIYLILPETRGYAPRGLDSAATVDPDGASRYLGDNQLDAFQGHIFYNGIANSNASFTINVYGDTTNEMPGLATRQVTDDASTRDYQGLTSAPKTDGVNGTPRIDSETRMTNFSTKFAVWY